MVRDAERRHRAVSGARGAAFGAGNMKMFTSLAAFGVLGADYRFETRLLTTGEQRGNTLQGISICRAAAIRRCIPTISTPFAATFGAAAFARIHGRLILDASAFDQTPFGAGWSWDDEPLPSLHRSRR